MWTQSSAGLSLSGSSRSLSLGLVLTLCLRHAFVAADTPRERAETLLAKMDLADKLALFSGVEGPYVGNTAPVPALGIPSLNLQDGPNGVADWLTEVTAFPSSLTVAASWDEDLLRQYGAALAGEQREKGSNVMLGPGVCLSRVPQGGRNFEYLSEDPILASRLGAAEIGGIQSQGVIANVKHFVNNAQEGPGHNGRLTTSVLVDERTQMELYYKPYRAAAAAGVGSVMCAYNLINGTYACENPQTLGDLKTKLGFDGWVVSDWGATHDEVASVLAGMDQTMSGGWSEATLQAFQDGTIPSERIDDMALRILTPMFAVGVFDRSDYGHPTDNVTNATQAAMARSFAERGTVLLKNNDRQALPLSLPDLRGKTIVVVGDSDTVKGSGSGAVHANYVITPAHGIREYVEAPPPLPPLPAQCTIDADFDYNGFDVATTGPVQAAQECCDVCAQHPACSVWSWNSGGNQLCYLKSSSAGRVPTAGVVSGTLAPRPACTHNVLLGVTVCDHSVSNSNRCPDMTQCPEQTNPMPAADIDAAVALVLGDKGGRLVSSTSTNGTSSGATSARGPTAVAIVVVGTTSGEGYDRGTLSLGAGQDELITRVAAVHANTIVVIRSPGAVTMPWVAHPNITAILLQFLPGQEGGRSLANTLFGDVNPSAKLPLSFPADEAGWLGSEEQYPGVNKVVTYTESLEMGYRFYHAHPDLPPPLFAFGYGLSYTTFSLTDLRTAVIPSSPSTRFASTDHPSVNTWVRLNQVSIQVNVTVTNTGPVTGAEVVQVYVTYPVPAKQPPRQLKTFGRVELASRSASLRDNSKATSALVSMLIPQAELAVWDIVTHDWSLLTGKYLIEVGAASDDIRLYGFFVVPEE